MSTGLVEARYGAAMDRALALAAAAGRAGEVPVGAVVLDAEGVAWQSRIIDAYDPDNVLTSCDAWVCCEDGGWATTETILEQGPVTVLYDPRTAPESAGER